MKEIFKTIDKFTQALLSLQPLKIESAVLPTAVGPAIIIQVFVIMQLFGFVKNPYN